MGEGRGGVTGTATLQPMDRTRPVAIRWMTATTCGFLVGYLAARATHNLGVTGLTPLSAVPRWALTGLLAAAFQSWLLGNRLPPYRRWLAVNTVAFALAGVPAAIPSPDPDSYGITWAIGGALIGVGLR
jgi:hypothetical protein